MPENTTTGEQLHDEATPRRSELRDPQTIVLSRLYPFTIARLYIPSHQNDGPITLTTLHNRRRAGELAGAVYRVRKDGRKAWFLRGAAILDLIGVEPKVIVKKPSRTRTSSVEALRGEGFKNA